MVSTIQDVLFRAGLSQVEQQAVYPYIWHAVGEADPRNGTIGLLVRGAERLLGQPTTGVFSPMLMRALWQQLGPDWKGASWLQLLHQLEQNAGITSNSEDEDALGLGAAPPAENSGSGLLKLAALAGGVYLLLSRKSKRKRSR